MPRMLALAAAANHPRLPVVRRPLVAILATGDELVAPGGGPGPDQIVASNSYGVAAMAGGRRRRNARPRHRRRTAASRIAAAIAAAREAGADIIVTLGGASVGDHDLVRETLAGEGMQLDFWKIAMRPGKPLMVGRFGATRVLGLPGNPVSSMVCAELFLRPLVRRLGGRDHRPDIREAILGVDLAENDQRQDYVRAAAAETTDGLVATPFGRQDSSMLTTLARRQCAASSARRMPRRAHAATAARC